MKRADGADGSEIASPTSAPVLMRGMVFVLLVAALAASASALRVPHVARRDVLALAGAALPAAASASGNVAGLSLSDMLDDAPAASDDALKKAEAYKAQQAKEAAMKEERAAVAIERMERNAETLQRSQERIAASGVPPCESGVWGSGNTGLLSAKTCSRVRDGLVEETKKTGFGIIF